VNMLNSSPSFGLGQRTVIVPVGNTLTKVDIATRRVLWSVMPPNMSGSFKHSPAIDEVDAIYIGSKSNADSRLYALDANGTIRWERRMGADMYPSPFLGDDGKLYLGSEQTPEGPFHAIDRATGNTVWAVGGQKDIPDFSFDSPLLYNGYAYFGVNEISTSASPALFKVKVDAQGYLPNAAWPRFHGGNGNTGRL
jgi:outer membrane protein assembly factor BamB